MILDNKLSWKPHITERCKKLSRVLGMLYKIRPFCPTTVKRSLYFSLFNSHLSYGLAAWGIVNKVIINKVTSLQEKAIKAISKHREADNIKISRKYFIRIF